MLEKNDLQLWTMMEPISRFLTDDNDIVLAPRFSPNNKEIVYTSYETGVPKVYLMNVDTLNKRVLDDQPGMTFAPRFSPDGRNVVMSLTDRGNTDIYSVVLESRRKTRLTSGPSIDTAPSFSPMVNKLYLNQIEAEGNKFI